MCPPSEFLSEGFKNVAEANSAASHARLALRGGGPPRAAALCGASTRRQARPEVRIRRGLCGFAQASCSWVGVCCPCVAARVRRPCRAGRSAAPAAGVDGFFRWKARAPLSSYEPKTHSKPLPRVLGFFYAARLWPSFRCCAIFSRACVALNFIC